MGPAHRKEAVSPPGLANSIPAPREIPRANSEMPLSFESIYRAHAKTVARWAARLLGPQGDVEDVMQDVFLVVRRRLPEFRGDAEITTWLYEITVRVVQGSRKRERWWSWLTGHGPSPSRAGIRWTFPSAVDSTGDPQQLLEARERTRLLYRLLNELAEEQRTAFILFELEGLSGGQIAEVTGATVATVWVRLSRARKKFLERMRMWEATEKP